MNPGVAKRIEVYRDRALGWKLSGAGGGGYLILVADRPIEHLVRVVVRREGGRGERGKSGCRDTGVKTD